MKLYKFTKWPTMKLVNDFRAAFLNEEVLLLSSVWGLAAQLQTCVLIGLYAHLAVLVEENTVLCGARIQSRPGTLRTDLYFDFPVPVLVLFKTFTVYQKN